ncbi:MAG: dihydrofolate reductase family protein [Dysosmobacter welbionis]
MAGCRAGGKAPADPHQRAGAPGVSDLSGRPEHLLLTGKERIDLARATEILATEFGVERMAVVGGSAINTSFLDAGLLDEVSILIGAGIDGRGWYASGVRQPAHGPPGDPAPDRCPENRQWRCVATVLRSLNKILKFCGE